MCIVHVLYRHELFDLYNVVHKMLSDNGLKEQFAEHTHMYMYITPQCINPTHSTSTKHYSVYTIVGLWALYMYICTYVHVNELTIV